MATVAVTSRRAGRFRPPPARRDRAVPAHRIQDRAQQRAQDRGVRLLRLVDGLRPTRPVSLNIMPMRRARRSDRRARDPAASDDARLALVVLDDRAVVEHGEVRAFLLRAPERLAIGVADVVHDVVLVDDRAADVRAPRPQHRVAVRDRAGRCRRAGGRCARAPARPRAAGSRRDRPAPGSRRTPTAAPPASRAPTVRRPSARGPAVPG